MTADKPTPKPALIPKLRFPEFRDEPEWKPAQLSSVAHFVNDRVSVSAIAKDEYVSTENILPNFAGIAPPSSFPASGSVTRFCINDVLIANIRPYLKKVWRATRSGGASNDVLVVRKKSDTSADYLAALLQSDAFIDYVMVGAKGVKMPRGDISLIKQYPVSIPKPAEQKKIAGCLGSLDDLIAAEGRKLEALKTHKKGLLQQLFPRPGETIPRLRFPEFRDAGEWQPTTIGKHVELLSGFPFAGTDIVEDKSGTRLLRGINITEGVIRHNVEIDRYYRDSIAGLEKYVLKKGDLVIGMDGSKVGKNSALITASDAGALLVQRVARLRAENNTAIRFIFYHVHSPKFHAYVDRINTSSGIPHISAKQINEFAFRLPSEAEQKKIADCLGSLDDLIAAEGRKLEALETHKKGLLQQLFPAMPEML